MTHSITRIPLGYFVLCAFILQGCARDFGVTSKSKSSASSVIVAAESDQISQLNLLNLTRPNSKNATLPLLTAAPILTYLASDSRLQHQTGYRIGPSWATDVNQPSFRFLTYGPYIENLNQGSYVARFALLVDNNFADDLTIASIDVYDANRDLVLSKQDLSRREFSGQGIVTHFDLPFDCPNNSKLEFRVMYHSSSYLVHSQTEIFKKTSIIAQYLPRDAKLLHQVGYPVGNTWSTDVSQPRERYLNYGPYETGIQAGYYMARFSLSVDNNSADNNNIARIDVFDASRGLVLNSRELTRRGFSRAGTPTDFEIPFVSSANASLEFRIFSHGNSFLQHMKTTILPGVTQPDVNDSRKKLIFSIDQSFGNGIVVNNDLVATKAIANALLPLTDKYNVYALLNPMTSNKQNLYNVLDTLVDNNIGFVLDVYTSDSSSLGLCTPGYPAGFTNPFGTSSLSIPLADLQYYKNRYGAFFAGIRIMEMLGQDNAYFYGHSDSNRPCWMNFIPYQSQYAVFQKESIESILQFSQSHGMFVQISDWNWSFAAGASKHSLPYEQNIRDAVQSVGGAQAHVYFTYDNNGTFANAFWNQTTQQADWNAANNSDWYKWAPGLRQVSGLGNQTRIGLSDQSWACQTELTCPAGNIITWAWGGLNNGVQLLQFESAWSLFNLPVGSFYQSDYTAETAYSPSLRGQPKDTFNQLSHFLLTSP